jgi:RNA polymerase sigma factor (sigma-70 family)
MEASSLTHASRSGLLARRSPLLRLQGDDRLVAMIRSGHDRAFEALFDRYHARLLAFCRHMLRSSEDAEDVLQEVFTNAHAAMVADTRPINVRPWLYRIARNRCLNHLRKPVAEGQDSMDIHPHDGGTSTAERVQKREDFRALVADVGCLAETQRTALLLREIDALSYEEIASAMDTTVPAVKSLLVRARMALADSTQSRLLTCGDVRLELAEAAEGLTKASGAVRQHVRRCEPCRAYRAELRSNGRALAALAPAGFLVFVHKLIGVKLGGSSSAAGGASAAGGSGAAAGGAGAAAAAGGGGLALGGAAAAAGGAAGGLGAKAAAGFATAALLTAGAVEVRQIYSAESLPANTPARSVEAQAGPGGGAGRGHSRHQAKPATRSAPVAHTETPTPPPVEEAPAEPTPNGVVGSAAGGTGGDTAASDSGTGPVLVVVADPTPTDPPDPWPTHDPAPTDPPPGDPPPSDPADPPPTDPPANPGDPPADPPVEP